jgi:hypothetical protein
VAKEKGKIATLMTPVGIVCFANIFTPRSFEAGKAPSYSMLLVFDKKGLEQKYFKGNKMIPHGTNWSDLRSKVGQAASGKFGAEEAKKLLSRRKLNLPWREGSEYEEYGPPFGDDSIFIRLSSKTAPGVVDAKRQTILDDSEFYSGCYARATAAVWPFDTAGNKGVTLLLNNVQKIADGERLSGSKRAAEDDFESASEDGDDNEDDIPF